MGLFGSVSGEQVDAFARDLAREMTAFLPAAPGPKGPTPKKIYIACETAFGKALEFRRQHKLGIYKKARLANTFRYELEAMGYAGPFAEEVAQRLAMHIAAKK
ncbi:MAG: hypothetical protein ACM30H_05315 [Clostridia bacterium]